MQKTIIDRIACKISFGTSEILFHFKRTNRKTLGIQVKPDGLVLVNAPKRASLDLICEQVQRKAGWILKKQNEFAQYPSPLPESQFVSGEEFRYLGGQYKLKIVYDEKEVAKLKGGCLWVYANRPDDKVRVKTLIDKWLQVRANSVFKSILYECEDAASRIGIHSLPQFKVKFMKTRWGSCSSKGNINFNILLLKAPKDCIKYVICHELCHLIEMNHSKAFYSLLTMMMPDWHEIRLKLNKSVELRLDY